MDVRTAVLDWLHAQEPLNHVAAARRVRVLMSKAFSTLIIDRHGPAPDVAHSTFQPNSRFSDWLVSKADSIVASTSVHATACSFLLAPDPYPVPRCSQDSRNVARVITELARRGISLYPNTSVHPNRRWQWMGKRGQILEAYWPSKETNPTVTPGALTLAN